MHGMTSTPHALAALGAVHAQQRQVLDGVLLVVEHKGSALHHFLLAVLHLVVNDLEVVVPHIAQTLLLWLRLIPVSPTCLSLEASLLAAPACAACDGRVCPNVDGNMQSAWRLARSSCHLDGNAMLPYIWPHARDPLSNRAKCCLHPLSAVNLAVSVTRATAKMLLMQQLELCKSCRCAHLGRGGAASKATSFWGGAFGGAQPMLFR